MPAGGRAVAGALRQRGLKLTVVSNANGKLKLLFDWLELAGCVDCLLDSHDEGIEKPDPRFFDIALERSGARRETTIHVGDLYHVDVVVRAPQACAVSCSMKLISTRVWTVRECGRSVNSSI